MSFELSEDHEQFRRTVRDFAEKEIAPHAAQWDRDHHFPVDVVQKMGALGPVRPQRPGAVRRRRRRLHQPVRGHRGDRPRRPVDGHHPGGRGRARHQPDPDLRHRRAEGHLAARPGRGHGSWPASGSPSRAPAPTPGPRRPRPSCATASGSSTAASSSSPTPAPRSPRLVTVTAQDRRAARTGKPEISTIIVPSGTPGFTAEKAYDKLGWHASDTHPLSFSDARVPGVQPARRARARLRPVPGHPRRRPGRHRRAGGRLHPGLPRHEPAVRRRADHLRRTHRAQAGRGLPDRRPRGDARRRRAS